MSDQQLYLATDQPPAEPAALVDDFTPSLITQANHHLCPGCGEPIALRAAVEAVEELALTERTITVFGIGCYTAFAHNLDVEVVQALHGRAPSVATGIKRMLPDGFVVTVQGDGDMVNEGLQEVLHAAARGENITCLLLNNGVFGETGGQMTTTTTLGQRTKTSIEGRDPPPARPPHPAVRPGRHPGRRGLCRPAARSTTPATWPAPSAISPGPTSRRWPVPGSSLVEILTMCPHRMVRRHPRRPRLPPRNPRPGSPHRRTQNPLTQQQLPQPLTMAVVKTQTVSPVLVEAPPSLRQHPHLLRVVVLMDGGQRHQQVAISPRNHMLVGLQIVVHHLVLRHPQGQQTTDWLPTRCGPYPRCN